MCVCARVGYIYICVWKPVGWVIPGIPHLNGIYARLAILGNLDIQTMIKWLNKQMHVDSHGFDIAMFAWGAHSEGVFNNL